MPSVMKMHRCVRRRLQRVVHKSRDKDYVRRALGLLALWDNANCVAKAARQVRAARSTVQRWRSLYEDYGEQGLKPLAPGRSDWKADESVMRCLEELLESTPQAYGYLRSRWSSELLAKVLFERTAVQVHASTEIGRAHV